MTPGKDKQNSGKQNNRMQFSKHLNINGKFATIAMAVLTASAISIHMSFKTSNVLTLILIVLCAVFYQNQSKQCDGMHLESHKTELILALTFSMCMSLKGLDVFDSYEGVGALGKLLLMGCQFAGFGILFYWMIQYLYQWENRAEVFLRENMAGKHIQNQEAKTQKLQEHRVVIVFFLAMLGILLCWLPYYLCEFPGIIISDTADQIQQAMGRYTYSNHHPVVQTWIIKAVFTFGKQVLRSAQAAVVLYCILQMCIIAAIDAFLIATLYQYRVKRWIPVLVFLYYALMPYHVLYSFNMWKDSLFGAFLLLFILVLWRILWTQLHSDAQEDRQSAVTTWGQLLLLYLSGMGVSLFRANGWYAYILAMPFLAILLWKKRRKTVYTLMLIYISVIIIKGPVFHYFRVADADFVESLSIPVQQIGRVITEGCELSEEQSALLSEIMDIEAVSNQYESYISDPMKNLIRDKGNEAYLEANKGAYLRLWAQLGLHYPSQYLRAFISQTKGYWYPDVQYWITADGVFSGGGEAVTAAPVLSASVKGKLEVFLYRYFQIPVIGLLFSIGLAVWAMFLQFGACIKSRSWEKAVLYIPLITLWLTLLVATPVYAEFRYIYGLFTCLPILLLLPYHVPGERKN